MSCVSHRSLLSELGPRWAPELNQLLSVAEFERPLGAFKHLFFGTLCEKIGSFRDIIFHNFIVQLSQDWNRKLSSVFESEEEQITEIILRAFNFKTETNDNCKDRI